MKDRPTARTGAVRPPPEREPRGREPRTPDSQGREPRAQEPQAREPQAQEAPGQEAPGGASGRRRASGAALGRAVLITAGLVTVYYLLPLDGRLTSGASAVLVCGLLLVVAVFWWEVRAIVDSPWPRLQAVEALATTVALFLLLFATAYCLLEHTTPGSFSEPLTKTDSLYFTLTTFTTVGYGDIVARSQTGRVLTISQMLCGLLLVGVAAKILAGAVRAGLRRQGREPADDFPRGRRAER